jgi:hypothetical protein
MPIGRACASNLIRSGATLHVGHDGLPAISLVDHQYLAPAGLGDADIGRRGGTQT